MSPAKKLIALVGFRPREIARIQQHPDWPLWAEILDGGHIDNGSNAASKAKRVAKKADVLLWRPQGMRKIDKWPDGCPKPILVKGAVSKAVDLVRRHRKS